MAEPRPPSKCRSCGAPIYWARSSRSGCFMPIDVEPTSTGNIVLYDRAGTTIAKVLRQGEELRPGARRRTSHLTTCSSILEHRRKAS